MAQARTSRDETAKCWQSLLRSAHALGPRLACSDRLPRPAPMSATATRSPVVILPSTSPRPATVRLRRSPARPVTVPSAAPTLALGVIQGPLFTPAPRPDSASMPSPTTVPDEPRPPSSTSSFPGSDDELVRDSYSCGPAHRALQGDHRRQPVASGSGTRTASPPIGSRGSTAASSLDDPLQCDTVRLAAVSTRSELITFS